MYGSYSEKVFCELELKSKGSKKKQKLMGLHETQKFLDSKETVNKTKRQPTEWKKIVSNDTSNKGLISKIYNEPIQPNSNKKTPKQSN